MKGLLAIAAVVLAGTAAGETEIRGLKHPALSPDGTRIAFDWHGDIWTVPIGGGRAEQLTYHSSDDDAPAWSPDGKWIAFQSNRDSNLDLPLNNNVWDLWKMPAGGGTATRLTRFRGENPAWSPDGKTIAYDRYSSGYADGEHNVFLIASDGSGVPLEIASGLEDTRHPTFKGNLLYFAHEANGIQTSGNRNVWKSTVRGGALIQVTGHRGDQVTWPSTVESSDQLVYEYDFDLYAIDLKRPKPRKLTITTDFSYDDPPVAQEFKSGFQSPAWSPSGREVVFSCKGDLWISSIDGGAARQLTSGLEDDREPSWSADGKSVVFCSGPPGMNVHVLMVDVKTGAKTAVSPETAAWRHPRLSPDGKRVLLSRQGDDSEDLWMIDVATRTAKPWAESRESEESLGAFSPDGTSVAYISLKGNSSEIVISSVDGTEIRRFEKARVTRKDLAWSPDGSLLAVITQTGQNKTAVQTVTPEGKALKSVGSAAASVSWSPDSSMLLVESEGARNATKISIVDALGKSSSIGVDVAATRLATRRDEMMGVFSQVFGSYMGNYYDPFFHGVDMPALREKYAIHAAGCQTKVELYDLINDMIKELHSSHIHLTPAPVKNSVVTACLGVELERSGPGTLEVRSVEPGGPAAAAGIHKGEAIVGNGKEIPADWDLDRWLTGEKLREVQLEIRDTEGGLRVVKVAGIDRNALRELKYENTIARRKALVKERSNGRLAYHHIKMMNAPEVTRLKSALEGDASDAEGLILDERDGVGGLAHRPVCSLLDSTAPERLNKVPACMMRNRNGSTSTDLYGQGVQGGRPSGKSWDKPVIMLQNSISRSDKEILPYTFRHLGIGFLVGMPTAGGVIGGSDWTMSDGSKITVSFQGWFTTDGRNMEGWGVPPDYRVPETHEDLYAGRDAQLEKAIEVLLAQMDGKIAAPRKPGMEKKVEGSSGK